MKNLLRFGCFMVLSGAVLSWSIEEHVPIGDGVIVPIINQTVLPQDALPSCTVTPALFNQWFASGRASENGLVLPASSVAFSPSNNCRFYQWSEQMFLWLTSPAGSYGGQGTVLESPIFYDVSTEDTVYQRRLVPHRQEGHLFNMTNRLVKNGPNRLPVVRTKEGRLAEVEKWKPQHPEKAIVSSATGTLTEVAELVKTDANRHRFLDASGKEIVNPKPVFTHRAASGRLLKELVVRKERVFLDASGKEVQVETGQATGDVLMTQNGSIVYYVSMVNDVYACFLTAAKMGRISGQHFPTTPAERDSIVAFAKANNMKLPDADALAMEIKSSWVELASLPVADQKNYVTVNAIIPVYDKTDSLWTPVGTRKAKMALIGIHVVGSVAGHPEMVWATFEQQHNAPNAAFAYVDVNGNTKSVAQQDGRGWQLSNTSGKADSLYNRSHMTSRITGSSYVAFDSLNYSDVIVANKGFVISASHTLRTMPWGSAADSATNQEDKSAAASNSEIISINNTIRNLLVGNDVRKNYLFMGATWTFGGKPPNGSSYGADTTAGVAIGTSALANSTMETYLQGSISGQGGRVQTSCLFCHSDNNSNLPGALSHIYTVTQPLSLTYRQLKNKKP